jgi:hypothetical protein
VEGNVVNENNINQVNETTPQSAGQQTPPEFANQFSVIARMEKKMREEREALKKREMELEERGKKYSGYDELDQLMEKNPLEALSKKGWDYEKLTQFALQNVSDEELDPVQRELKTTKSKLEEFEKSFDERVMAKVQELIGNKEKEYESKAHELEIKNIRKTIEATVEANKEKYEFINAYNDVAKEEAGEDGKADSALDLIFDAIQSHVVQQREDGVPEDQIKMLSYTEAADRVEAYLEGKLQKFLTLSKVKSKLNPAPQTPDSLIKSFQTKTISDDFTPRSVQVNESEEDRVRKAIELVSKGIAI